MALKNRLAPARRVRFIVHQLCEYLVALLLLAASIHLTGGPRLLALATGFAIGVLNLCSKAPLGVYGRASRGLHHGLDLLVALGALVTPLVFLHALGLSGLGLGVVVAVILVGLERATDYREQPPRPRRVAPSLGPAAVASVAPVAGVLARRSVRGLGRLTGQATRLSREAAQRRAAASKDRPS